jgi:hypothetical protein
VKQRGAAVTMTYLRTPIFQGGGGNNDTDAVLIRLLKMFPKRIRRHRNQKCIQKLGKKIISMQAQTNQKLQGKKIEKKKYAGLLIYFVFIFFYNLLSLSYLLLFLLVTSLSLLLFPHHQF